MSEPAIIVDGISKRYRIGVAAERYPTFRDALVGAVKAPIRRWRRLREHTDGDDTIWALKDVSFEVQPGEVVGIIGRNGAGKSTLLKVLSRITDPTEGYAELNGRVASLLEVGTGFHPELTGRENIYLNGAILGMKKAEIDRKFDEIVAFAEIEKFLDTPVKRYSSGMYVRLAFAVAAHLEPEILIVDEVLAVGDAEFQKKCLGRMRDVAAQGRTVLFVSHNLGAVAELCTRCLCLADGRAVTDGDPSAVIGQYVASSSVAGEVDLRGWTIEGTGDGPMRVEWVATVDADGNVRSQFAHGDTIHFRVLVKGKAEKQVTLAVSIRSTMGQTILHFSSKEDSVELMPPANEVMIDVCMPNNVLNDGRYFVTIWLGDGYDRLHDRVGNCLAFDVDSSVQGRITTRGWIRIPVRWAIAAERSSLTGFDTKGASLPSASDSVT